MGRLNCVGGRKMDQVCFRTGRAAGDRFQVGAVSVLGFQRADVPSYVDQRVLELDQVVISAGRPDVGLVLVPVDLVKAMDGAQLGDYCEDE
jgi:prolyl-tRNA editing enzyme YbaK/EbsC (Cys-tRNA(Pro) deacylase)